MVRRALKAARRSDVCLLVIDATDGLSEQEARLSTFANEAGRACVVVVNKWDLVEKETNTARDVERAAKAKVGTVDHVPFVFASALTGQRAEKVLDMALAVYDERAKRVPTAELNEVVQVAVRQQYPPSWRGNYVQVKFATQVRDSPPVFAFFCNHPQGIKESYKRYLENKLRDAFGFEGVPLTLSFKKK